MFWGKNREEVASVGWRRLCHHFTGNSGRNNLQKTVFREKISETLFSEFPVCITHSPDYKFPVLSFSQTIFWEINWQIQNAQNNLPSPGFPWWKFRANMTPLTLFYFRDFHLKLARKTFFFKCFPVQPSPSLCSLLYPVILAVKMAPSQGKWSPVSCFVFSLMVLPFQQDSVIPPLELPLKAAEGTLEWVRSARWAPRSFFSISARGTNYII